jgi:hypothetical protein
MIINYHLKNKIKNNLKQVKTFKKNKKLKKTLTPKSCRHKTVPSIISKVTE